CMLELWQAAKTKGIDLPETPDRLYFGGNAERGRKLVLNHAAAQCIRCHQLGKDGSNLGPNLSKIGARRTREHLVTSMLQPTKEISEGYGTIVLKTRDGEEINGLLTRKSEDFWVVTMADGKKRNLRPHEISSHTLSSTMPPLGALMKAEEIRDVVEYLSELK
ncbi:MAG: c-type cytochrome, partial [Akkermansiaceae bacterium]